MITTQNLRILCELILPTITIRLWDGSGGVFIDDEGEQYLGAVLTEDALSTIEGTINGHASYLDLSIKSSDDGLTDLVWSAQHSDDLIGGILNIYIQPCDEYSQSSGEKKQIYSGSVDNIIYSKKAEDTRILDFVTLRIANKFTLRKLTNGATLSDVDQKARSAKVNPTAPLDRFCEFINTLREKEIKWPDW